MCFIEDNKNFINIKLHAEMKGLTDDEKLKKYRIESQEDTRKRLKASYIKCTKKLDFYSEALDELSFFESDFLMLNLFLEKETNNLFTFLSSNSFENLNFGDQESISYKFWDFLSRHSTEATVSEFLKITFIVLLDITEREWKDENESKNPVIKAYAKWLIKSLENDEGNGRAIFSYFLFCKLWNHFSLYTEKFNEKAIIFYKTINEQFDDLKHQGIFLNLYKLINQIKEKQTELFKNESMYFPLLDNKDNDSAGYLLRRNEFKNKVKESEILCYSFIDKSFSDIFYLMLGEEKTVCDKLYQKDIVGKLNEFQLPDSEQIRELNKIEGEKNIDKFKKDLFRRLYLFEQL